MKLANIKEYYNPEKFTAQVRGREILRELCKIGLCMVESIPDAYFKTLPGPISSLEYTFAEHCYIMWDKMYGRRKTDRISLPLPEEMEQLIGHLNRELFELCGYRMSSITFNKDDIVYLDFENYIVVLGKKRYSDECDSGKLLEWLEVTDEAFEDCKLAVNASFFAS